MNKLSDGLILILVGGLLLAIPAGGASAKEGVLKGAPDPAVIRSDSGWIYVFSTGKGLPVRRSRDMLQWEYVGTVFDEPVPEWAVKAVPGTRGIWAPDISHRASRYWLYYSVSTFGSQRSCIGLATNVTLDPADDDYEWIDRGKVIDSAPGRTNFNAIDPAAFTDASGTRWLTWGSFWDGIKMMRLDELTGKPHSAGERIYSLARRPVAHAIEAPYIVYRQGFYYLFVSFGACCDGLDSTYRIMVGRSKAVTGPYIDIQGRQMLDGGGSLLLASHENWRGPGHNSVLTTDHGDWLVHHTYDARQEKGPRNLQIRPLIWGRQGWPLAGEPIETSGAKKKPTPADIAGHWTHSVDYGKGSVIRLRPDGRAQGNKNGQWSFDDGMLRIEWPRSEDNPKPWIDECHLAPDGQSYIGRNQTGAVIRGIRVNP
ncbi:MAG: family 43 glycosylhydrolase [Planctomycetes bacterium]|nr:family 43 glycosylhydrolase [Planctomycetota bacterium]